MVISKQLENISKEEFSEIMNIVQNKPNSNIIYTLELIAKNKEQEELSKKEYVTDDNKLHQLDNQKSKSR